MPNQLVGHIQIVSVEVLSVVFSLFVLEHDSIVCRQERELSQCLMADLQVLLSLVIILNVR